MVKRAAVPAPLIWERLQGSTPGKQSYYGEIISAGIRIADRHGLPALSMRSVADALGAGTMSLYRYVQSKDELLDLILDSAYGEIRLPARHSGEWSNDVARVAKATRRALKRHPWLSALGIMRPTLGPNYLRWFEFLLQATHVPGRSIQIQARMIGTVGAFVAGFVGYELGELENRRRHNLTEAQMRRSTASYMERVLMNGEFPNLGRFIAAGVEEPGDAAFEFGLQTILAGLST